MATKKKPAPKAKKPGAPEGKSSKRALSDDEMKSVSGGTHGGIQPAASTTHGGAQPKNVKDWHDL